MNCLCLFLSSFACFFLPSSGRLNTHTRTHGRPAPQPTPRINSNPLALPPPPPTEAVEGHTRNWHEVLEFGSRLALGGPAIGASIGLAGAFVLGYVINDALVEVSLTVLLAFSTFALCEATRVKVITSCFGRNIKRPRMGREGGGA